MVVERFSQSVINSGIFRVYIATGFFATAIFFTVNSDFYTPFEMMFGVIGITIILKGISNMMLSLLIMLFSLENQKNKLDFNYHSENIDSLVNELDIIESKKML